MSGISTRRAIVTLGMSFALAAGAAAMSYAADQGPRPLPANPQAQTPQDRGGQPAPGLDRRGERPGPGERANARLDRRLDYLHRSIGITVAQERLWMNFADAVRAEERGPGVGRGPGNGPGADRGPGGGRDFGPGRNRQEPSVVERLEQRQQQLADEGADVNRLLAALRPLYASLSPDQKRIADENLFHPERERFAGRGRFGRDGFDGGRFRRPPDRNGPPDYEYR